MVDRLDAIELFLNAQEFKNPIWHRDLETQVNVHAADGERKTKKYKGKPFVSYSKDKMNWFPFRIPKKAFSEDHHYKDMRMTYDISLYAEGIGSTGWNHVKDLSEWFGYDIDSVVGHTQGLSAEEIADVIEKLKQIDWVTIRKSKSGNGYHAFVFLDTPEPCKTHHEHAALAKSILHKMSGQVGFRFKDKFDCVGSNMWLWHKDSKPENGAFEIVKEGSKLQNVPLNWRDHIARSKKRGAKRALLKTFSDTVGEEVATSFEDLSAKTRFVALTERHRKLIKYLDEKNMTHWWDDEHHCLVTHTRFLGDAHKDLGLSGIYFTNSKGQDTDDHNCFVFPNLEGWTVRRHTKGTPEHDYWVTDSAGWTMCDYDRSPHLMTVIRTYGGVQGEKLDYKFQRGEGVARTLEAIGIPFECDKNVISRSGYMLMKKEHIVIKFPWSEHDVNCEMGKWRAEPDSKPKFWVQVFKHRDTPNTNIETNDEILRSLQHQDNFEAFYLRLVSGKWTAQPVSNLIDGIQAHGYSVGEARSMKGQAVINPWQLESLPFETEYPGDRKWNLRAAKLAHEPREGIHSTWDLVLRHIGNGLNTDVESNEWCKKNAISTGADYLTLWLAWMFQKPRESLPFLFFYSQKQNTGKSSFHEAISLLFSEQRGYVAGNNALKNPQGFNGELHGAVLVIIEEIDLNQKIIYDRAKDWITSKYLTIHPKGGTPYTVQNTTHWMQFANESTYCPVFDGDTRIVMTHVDTLEMEIDSNELFENLEDEAPHFLHTILNLTLPKPIGRLRLPVLETAVKASTVDAKRSPFETFCNECVFQTDGHLVNATMLYETAKDWIQEHFGVVESDHWTNRKMQKAVPRHWVSGLHGRDRKTYYANLTLDENATIGAKWYKPLKSRELMKYGV